MTLLQALDEVADGPAAHRIRDVLAQTGSKTIRWPDDQAFERDWLRRPFYGNIRRDRVAMILQAIEEHYQSADGKAEPIVHFDYSALQIEHILPQAWHKTWPVEGEEAARARDAKINAVGNLTLVSEKLNPTLSNAPWLDAGPGKRGKRSALNEHSMLRMNAKLVKEYPEYWDETCIDERARDLFKTARVIWPHPDSLSD